MKMLKERVEKKPTQIRVLITLTNLFGPNISKMIPNHWNLLSINEPLKEIFNCKPTTTLKRNKKLKKLNKK